MTQNRRHKRTAIWAITANGVRLGRRVQRRLPGSRLFHSIKFDAGNESHHAFESLKDALLGHYEGYDAHLFIMAKFP